MSVLICYAAALPIEFNALSSGLSRVLDLKGLLDAVVYLEQDRESWEQVLSV